MAGRNAHHLAIQHKLKRLGTAVEVRIIAECMDENSAFALEMERISFWRADGADLANKTDGGEGTVGRKHTEEWKAAHAARHKGSKRTAEWSRAQSARNLGRKHTPEAIEKMRKSSTGKNHTAETKAKIAIASSLRKHSEETRRKMSIRNARNKNWLGKIHKPETIEKMRQSRRNWWAQKKALSQKETN